jgi:hypothetical protein
MDGLELGELIRVSLAAAYAIFGLVLICFGGKPSTMRLALIAVAFFASGITLFHTLGHRIAPWPAAMALLFVVVLIHGTIKYRRGDFDD